MQRKGFQSIWFRYFSRVSTGFGLAVLMGLLSPIEAAGPKSIELRWNFSQPEPLVYSIDQEIKTQLDQYDATTRDWKKTPVGREVIHGNCFLHPRGDGTSRGELILQLKESENPARTTPLPTEQFIPQMVAKFTLTGSGNIEDYAGGSVEETYLFLRLILGLPPNALHEHEGRIIPLELYTQGQTTELSLIGSVIHELEGFEIVDGLQCARLKCQISLASRLDRPKHAGSVQWKGDATVYYAIDEMRLHKAMWNVGKLVEIKRDESELPTRMVTIFTIDCAFVRSRDPLTQLYQMTPITPSTPLPAQ